MWVVNMGHILQLLIFETVLRSIDWFVVCVKGSETNGHRERGWFRHPSKGGVSPAISNRHR